MEYAKPGEATVARRLIREALRLGYHVSVNDGEETTVKRSTDADEIANALCSTGEDTLIFHLLEGKSEGAIYLVWGNDPSGEELIADHTDNRAMNELYALTYNS